MDPRKSATIRTAMMAKVRLALRDTGGRKTVIPLLMASIPVNAVQPAAKVCSSRTSVIGTPVAGTPDQSPGPSRAAVTSPATSIAPNEPRNR